MPFFAANLTMMFNEWPFMDRFAAAADAGFRAVEYLFPYEHAPDAIAAQLERHRLVQALFNLPPGDWGSGDRGLAALPERQDEFRKSIDKALPYARATGVPHLHVMSGLGNRGNGAALAVYRNNLKYACDRLGQDGIGILIEPINSRDMPGYFLDNFDFAAELIASLGLPNLKLQYDIYHRQIIHGDIIKSVSAMLPIIGHIQTASVPGRHEPGTGEINDTSIFRHIDQIGYKGYIGCEYRPKHGTMEGLSWLKQLNF